MRPLTLRRDQRGIALPVALFALVVIGVLVGGVFFTARLEMRGGESAMAATRANEAAQGGLMMGVPSALTVGGSLIDGATYTGTRTQIGTSGSYYTYTVTRLNKFVFLVKSLGEYEGKAGTVVARRTMAYIVKRYMPEVDVNAGAIVVGNATVSGSASLDGNDQLPPGWTDCTTGPAQPGLRTNGTASLSGNGSVAGSGTPAYTQNDTTVVNMSRIMDTMFMQLASQANVKLGVSANGGPVVSGSTCVKTDSTNWGDPDRHSPTAAACETYFPIVYFNNNVTTTTYTIHGDGQGVLLVNGNLRFNGNSHYVGLIIVRGSFQGGTGNINIDGSLLSLNADLTADNIQGNIDLDYSTCAVSTALNNLSVSAPATYRGFMQF